MANGYKRVAPDGVVVLHINDLAGIHPMSEEAVARMAAIEPWRG